MKEQHIKCISTMLDSYKEAVKAEATLPNCFLSSEEYKQRILDFLRTLIKTKE